MENISRMVSGKTAQQLVNSAGRTPQRFNPVKSVSAETAEVVNRLFEELQAIFPAWRYSCPTDKAVEIAKKNWIKAFVDEGINSIEQIQLGLKLARKSKNPYMPATGVFIDWCKPSPEDCGLPSREDAFAEAIANLGTFITAKWSHPAVREAVKATSCYVLRSNSEKDARAAFYRNYGLLVERVIRGENLMMPIPKAITNKQVFIPAPPEVEAQCLSSLKRLVGLE